MAIVVRRLFPTNTPAGVTICQMKGHSQRCHVCFMFRSVLAHGGIRVEDAQQAQNDDIKTL